MGSKAIKIFKLW